METTNLLSNLQRVLKCSRGMIRVKVAQDDEPSDWGSWVICPESGYLEIQGYGPFLLRNAEWFEVKSPLVLGEAIEKTGFPRWETAGDDTIRVYYPA